MMKSTNNAQFEQIIDSLEGRYGKFTVQERKILNLYSHLFFSDRASFNLNDIMASLTALGCESHKADYLAGALEEKLENIRETSTEFIECIDRWVTIKRMLLYVLIAAISGVFVGISAPNINLTSIDIATYDAMWGAGTNFLACACSVLAFKCKYKIGLATGAVTII